MPQTTQHEGKGREAHNCLFTRRVHEFAFVFSNCRPGIAQLAMHSQSRVGERKPSLAGKGKSVDFVPSQVCYSIATSKLRIKGQNLSVVGSAVITVRPTETAKMSLYYALQTLKEQLPSVVIKGIPSTSRAVIHADDTVGLSYGRREILGPKP